MFRKVKNWVRGSDHKLSTSPSGSKSKTNHKQPKQHKGRKNFSNGGNNFSNSRLHLDDLSDGFKPHNIDGFDLVLTENNNDNDALREPASNIPNLTDQKTEIAASEEIEITSIESLNLDQETGEYPPEKDSIEDSGCVVLTPTSIGTLAEQTAQMDAFGHSKLSIDEKETLDLLDSIVNDFDVENFDDETNEIETDDDTNFLKKHGNAESRRSNPINYTEVVGEYPESIGSTNTNENNWKVTGFSQQKGLYFKTNDMYFPSSESTRRSAYNSVAPELPPPDYPQSEDDSDGEAIQNATTYPLEVDKPNESSALTSFSKRSIYDLTEIGLAEKPTFTDVEKTEMNREIEDDTDFVNKKVEDVRTTCDGSVNSTSSSLSYSNGSLSNSFGSENFTASSPNTKKRFRPRVTSFKATPQVLSAKPVNDLVKKFENYHNKGESF